MMFCLNTTKKQNESEENNLDLKGAAKANAEAHGPEVGWGKGLSEIVTVFVEGCCFISALRTDRRANK